MGIKVVYRFDRNIVQARLCNQIMAINGMQALLDNFEQAQHYRRNRSCNEVQTAVRIDNNSRENGNNNKTNNNNNNQFHNRNNNNNNTNHSNYHNRNNTNTDRDRNSTYRNRTHDSDIYISCSLRIMCNY